MTVAILGLAAYPRNRVWANVELLVRSARRNSPQSHVVLLTSPLSDADRRQFDRFAVEAVECVDSPPPEGVTRESHETRMRWILELFGRRQFLYREIIKTRDYSHVLLSDTRDVIVTAELQHRTSASLLVLSQEDRETSISGEPYNRRWITEGYGQGRLAAIGTKPILCAGTVFGPSAAIAEYLLAMSGEVQRIGVETTRRIGDQPLHNHLAYKGSLPEYTVSAAEDGWLRSIGIQRFEQVNLDWDPAGRSPEAAANCAVVHQYDRHLAHQTMRNAVARVAGLPRLHPWRFEAYRDHGKGFGSRVLRKLGQLTTPLVQTITFRQSQQR